MFIGYFYTYYCMNIYKNDILTFLQDVSIYFRRKVDLVAVGGTALTLMDLKASTIDIDFDIPNEKHVLIVEECFRRLGFDQLSHFSWKCSSLFPFRVDLFKQGYIFCVQLLEDSRKNAKPVMSNKKLSLFTLNPYNLIATKLIRGTSRDIDDALVAFHHSFLELSQLLEWVEKTAAQALANEKDIKANVKVFLKHLHLGKKKNG